MIVRRTSELLAKRIYGTVVSYNSGTGALVVSLVAKIGTGTFTDWTISIRPATAGIDGYPAYVMYPGEVRLVQCDGTVLRTVILKGFNARWSVSGAFVTPPGYANISGRLCSGGSSGAVCITTEIASASGGNGGRQTSFNISPPPNSVIGFVIGAGGAAATITSAGTTFDFLSAFGNPGGGSSFGEIISTGAGGTAQAQSGIASSVSGGGGTLLWPQVEVVGSGTGGGCTGSGSLPPGMGTADAPPGGGSAQVNYTASYKGQTFGTAAISPPRLNLLRIEEDLSQAHLRLARCCIEHLDWQACVNKYDRPATLFYFDPPYWQTEGYDVPFGMEQYKLMAQILKSVNGKAILSVNDHPDMRDVF